MQMRSRLGRLAVPARFGAEFSLALGAAEVGTAARVLGLVRRLSGDRPHGILQRGLLR
jgi:hypothetical protein